MARKIESKYQNWDEVNEAMKRLAELNVNKNKLEAYTNERIDKVKAEANLQVEPILKEIKDIEKDITRFAEQHKEEFTKKRTKILNFGKISFRYTKSFKIPNVDSAINALKSFALDEYLRIKEELNKETLTGLDVKTLAKCNIFVTYKDKITIEPDYVKLAALNDNEEIPF